MTIEPVRTSEPAVGRWAVTRRRSRSGVNRPPSTLALSPTARSVALAVVTRSPTTFGTATSGPGAGVVAVGRGVGFGAGFGVVGAGAMVAADGTGLARTVIAGSGV